MVAGTRVDCCLEVPLLAVTPIDAEESSVEEVDPDAEWVAVGVRVGFLGGEPRLGAHE
jgi:hypothetical protein